MTIKCLTKLLTVALLFLLASGINLNKVFAVSCNPLNGYDYHQTCINLSPGACGTTGFVCELRPVDGQNYCTLSPSSRRCNNTGSAGVSVLGGVTAPQGVLAFNRGTASNIGIIAFISNLLIIFTIIAGLWVLVNILRAAYMFITGMGDPGTYQKVQELATMSGIGVAIIAGAYILAGLIGLILFGDPTYILSPKLDGALS